MRITNLDTGQPYQLDPDTQLSVERTNPFFNDYAEQTIPASIPASDHNLTVLGLHAAEAVDSTAAEHDVAIQDGEYCATCRQAILAVTHNGSISTAFYINDGSFYARLGETSLKDIWTDTHERMPVEGTVDTLIAFCRQLAQGTTQDASNYRIFPVLLHDDSGQDTGFTYKILNNWGTPRTVNGEEHPHTPLYDNGTDTPDFLNAQPATEVIDGTEISVPKGYFISPFIRVKYVLERIFAFFGYTLQTTFFSSEPFKSMVLVNNVIDTIINGYVLNRDLVPEMTCREFLALFRSKFCCEFDFDENNRTATIVFFKDIADAQPAADLTQALTDHPTVNFRAAKQYSRVKLKPRHTIEDERSTQQSYEDLQSLLHDCPAAEFNAVYGYFYKTGYSGIGTLKQAAGTVEGYDAGGDQEPHETELDEAVPPIRLLYYNTATAARAYACHYFLYIGKYKTLHSKVSGTEGDMADTGDVQQLPIFAFALHTPIGPAGTTSSWTVYDQFPQSVTSYSLATGTGSTSAAEIQPRHVFDYSLFYWGDDGLFERFHRKMDLCLRNALDEVKAKLLLTRRQQASVKATAVYAMHGQRFLFDKLRFQLGRANDPQECTLRSLTLKRNADGTLSEAGTIDELLPINNTDYKWVAHMTEGAEMWRFAAIFPPVADVAFTGVRYGLQTVQYLDHETGTTVTKEFWLECVHK